jgi:hypothetical protein
VTAEDAAQDDLERLYGVPPEEFMALRKQLVAAAKQRGDADAAKLIGAARRPTAAAWVVNLLVRHDSTAQPRLNELTEALRAAHSAMDGSRIRELTSVQRKLIDTLVRAGLVAAGYADATAAMRNDVTDTLQAAIADPDVAARLGRLEKAERWSGFGDFGESSAVARGPERRETPLAYQPVSAAPHNSDDGAAIEAARARRAVVSAEVDTAETALREARDSVVERRGKVATARRRYEKILETLSAAERQMEAAEAAADAAEQSAEGAGDRLAKAKDELARAERALDVSE